MKLKLPRFTIQITAAYEREILRKPINRVKFFIGAGFLIFVAFFILGVRPVAISAAENTKFLLELKEIRTNMETKDKQLLEGEKILTEYKNGIGYMSVLLPSENDIQNFLEDFVVTAAKNGFFVRRFIQPPAADGFTMPIEIDVVGKLNKLPELVEAVERTPRITNINEIVISMVEDDLPAQAEPNHSIKLRMEVYSLK